MTTVTLAALMESQRESLKVKPRRRTRVRMPAIPLAPARRIALMIMTFIIRSVIHHGLVVAACTCLVISAAMLAPALGFLAAALSLFFLEARRP